MAEPAGTLKFVMVNFWILDPSLCANLGIFVPDSESLDPRSLFVCQSRHFMAAEACAIPAAKSLRVLNLPIMYASRL